MLLHWLATLAITLAVLIGVGLGAFAWRLSQGPLELPWITSRLEAAANANGGPTRLTIGAVALAWEGFRGGVDRPLDFRVTNVTVSDQVSGRRLSIPRAEASLSLSQLLLGRVALRAVEIDSPRLTVLRAADGTLGLGFGGFGEAAASGEPNRVQRRRSPTCWPNWHNRSAAIVTRATRCLVSSVRCAFATLTLLSWIDNLA